MDQPSAQWVHSFRMEFDGFAWSDDGAIDPDWEVDVLTDVIHKKGGLLVIDAVWRPMDVVLGWFGPTPVTQDAEVDEAEVALPSSAAWLDSPWLMEEFVFQDMASDVAKLRQKAGVDVAVAGIMAEVSADDVMDALYERRAELAADAPAPLRDFVYVVRGGTWTAEHVGLPYDSFRGEARGGEAKRFCDRFKLTKTATFAIRLYTEALAQELAIEWCTRRQFFYDLWDAGGRPADFQFSAEDIASYVERLAFSEAAAVAGPRCLVRVNQIRAERPCRVDAWRWLLGGVANKVSESACT